MYDILKCAFIGAAIVLIIVGIVSKTKKDKK